MKNPKMITYSGLIARMHRVNVPITWRTLNYYKSLGLIPKSGRVKGDKQGYYPEEIFDLLLNYNFLQNQLRMQLKDIKELFTSFGIDPQDMDQLEQVRLFNIHLNGSFQEYSLFLRNRLEELYLGRGVLISAIINDTYRAFLEIEGVTLFRSFMNMPMTVRSGRSLDFETAIGKAKKWGRQRAENALLRMFDTGLVI